MQKPHINIIAAVSLNGVIGKNNDIPWRIPSDLKRFKDFTIGSTVIMGRKTWISLPKKPLKDRRNIVLSKTGQGLYGVENYSTFQAAIDACYKEKDVWVIGGEKVYEEAIKIADEVQLTEVVARFEGDAFFPMENLKKLFKPKYSSVIFEENGHSFCYSTWVKK